MYYNKSIYTHQPDAQFFYQPYSFNPDNIKTINSFYDKIFHYYSKIVPVRVDFEIKRDFINEYDYEEIRRLFTKLRNNKRNNKLFEHCISYLSRLEYAKLTGWHLHVLFIFNGQYIQSDYYYANEICRYWVDKITNGKGRAYSPNMDENYIDKYDENHMALGGCVEYCDNMKIKALIQVSYYLAKETDIDLNAKQRVAPHSRFFNAGQIKTHESTQRGRPRKNVEYAENPELGRTLSMLNREW